MGYRSQGARGEMSNDLYRAAIICPFTELQHMISVKVDKGGEEEYVLRVVKRSRKGGSVEGRKDHRIIIGSH